MEWTTCEREQANGAAPTIRHPSRHAWARNRWPLLAMTHALLFSVFITASCGLAYELIAGALISYLLGDSVTQFATIIGTYLLAMGIGSWLSHHVEQHLVARFIQIELMVGVVGCLSATGLFFFAWSVALSSWRCTWRYSAWG